MILGGRWGPIVCVVAGQTHSSLLLSKGGGAHRDSLAELVLPATWGRCRDGTRRKAAPPGGRGLTVTANETQWLPYTLGSKDWGSIPALPPASCVILGPSPSLPELQCPHPQNGVIVAGSWHSAWELLIQWLVSEATNDEADDDESAA